MKKSRRKSVKQYKQQQAMQKAYFDKKATDLIAYFNKNKENIIPVIVTNHFAERFNQRVMKADKSNIEKFIQSNTTNLKHLSEDHWVLGDIIMVLVPEYDKVQFNKVVGLVCVTILASVTNDPMIYDLLRTSGGRGLRRFQNNYGKVEIQGCDIDITQGNLITAPLFA